MYMCMFVACNAYADIAVVLDASTQPEGANDQRWQQLRSFVNRLIEVLPIGESQVHLALVRYARAATVDFRLDRYYDEDELRRVVDGLQRLEDRERNLGEGVSAALNSIFTDINGDRRNAPDYIIAVTSGTSDDNYDGAADRARLANPPIRLSAVGFGPERDLGPGDRGLQRFADGDLVWFFEDDTQDENRLILFAEQVLSGTCNVRRSKFRTPCKHIYIYIYI